MESANAHKTLLRISKEKKFDLNDNNEKTFTIKKYFPSWLTYSRNNFTKFSTKTRYNNERRTIS